jgi:hypothetical protein
MLTLAISSSAETLASGSTVCVDDMDGFGTYVMAAIAAKRVPLAIVTDCARADFRIRGAAESEKSGWARTIFLKQTGSNEQASITLIHVRTSAVVFAYAVNKHNSVHGKQSAAESCAKYLGNFMKKGGAFAVAPEETKP